jgi:ribosomal protein L19E
VRKRRRRDQKGVSKGEGRRGKGRRGGRQKEERNWERNN